MKRGILPSIFVVLGIVWILINYQDAIQILFGGYVCMAGLYIATCERVYDLIHDLKKRIKKLEGNA